MLRVPIDPYRSRRPDGRTYDVSVELDDEGAIAVSIDVDPRGLTTTHRRPHDDVDAVLESVPAEWDLEGIIPDKWYREALILGSEVRRLREELGSRVDSIDLHPEPIEARAIAAALVHHADEVDRVFGRS